MDKHLYLGTLPNGRIDLEGNLEDGPARIVYHHEAPEAPRRVIARVERQGEAFVCGALRGRTVREAAEAYWRDLEERHQTTVSARELRRLQARHEERDCLEMEEARGLETKNSPSDQ